MNKKLAGSLVAIGLAISFAAHAAGVTDAMIEAKSTNEILSVRMGLDGEQYSPLKDLNAKNVNKLVPAWSFSFGGEKQRGQESQPLIHNGKMFVTASYSRVFAIDVKTGEKLWKYEQKLPAGMMPCCDVINRGVALYGNLVIFGTLDAELVALDQDTGKVVWKEKMEDYAAGYSISSAPIIAEGLLLSGMAGGEFGVVGRVEARDPNTGKLVWSRPTVEGYMGYKYDKDGNKTENGITGTVNASWPGELWKSGGAAPWLGGTFDAKTGLSYWGTGNPAPWNSYLRPGDNLYSCSTVAIDVKTGQIKWSYQNTPHDGWDYDAMTELVLFDLNGKRATGKADKNGFFYVNDAQTGKLLNAFPFVNKITWATGINLTTGRPNYVESNRPGDPSQSTDGKKGTTVFAAPSFLGGKNQQAMSYSPSTKLFYVPANEWGMDIWNEPVSYKKGSAYLGAGFTIKPIYDDYIGAMRAFDPKTGKKVWEVKNKAPLWGGALSTGGDLVFYGTPEGYLKALDAKTGKELWKFQVGTGIVGSPVTWKEGNEQWVAVVAGWGGAVPLWGGEVGKKVSYLEQGGSVWVFKIPSK